MAALHITPVNDATRHDTATSQADCICGPSVQPVKQDDGSMGWLLVHHSLDGRDRLEAEVP